MFRTYNMCIDFFRIFRSKNSTQTIISFDECPICLEFKCLIELNKCKHMFCKDCITQWITYLPDSKSCPTCREPVKLSITKLKLFQR